jgi:hypothetical protein
MSEKTKKKAAVRAKTFDPSKGLVQRPKHEKDSIVERCSLSRPKNTRPTISCS